MNWDNVNLNDGYEREQNILDPLDFDTLLLEINCNCRDINEETIRGQFELDLKIKMDSARDIFEANLNNLLNKALEERNSN